MKNIFESKEVISLREENVSLKKLLEQSELKVNNFEKFIDDNFPAINEIEIKRGWYGDGTSTFKVTIDVFSADLLKIIGFLTNKSLSKKKYDTIIREYERLNESKR